MFSFIKSQLLRSVPAGMSMPGRDARELSPRRTTISRWQWPPARTLQLKAYGKIEGRSWVKASEFKELLRIAKAEPNPSFQARPPPLESGSPSWQVGRQLLAHFNMRKGFCNAVHVSRGR